MNLQTDRVNLCYFDIHCDAKVVQIILTWLEHFSKCNFNYSWRNILTDLREQSCRQQHQC